MMEVIIEMEMEVIVKVKELIIRELIIRELIIKEVEMEVIIRIELV